MPLLNVLPCSQRAYNFSQIHRAHTLEPATMLGARFEVNIKFYSSTFQHCFLTIAVAMWRISGCYVDTVSNKTRADQSVFQRSVTGMCTGPLWTGGWQHLHLSLLVYCFARVDVVRSLCCFLTNVHSGLKLLETSGGIVGGQRKTRYNIAPILWKARQ